MYGDKTFYVKNIDAPTDVDLKDGQCAKVILYTVQFVHSPVFPPLRGR